MHVCVHCFCGRLALLNACHGGLFSLLPSLTSDLFGHKNFGPVFSLLFAARLCAAACICVLTKVRLHLRPNPEIYLERWTLKAATLFHSSFSTPLVMQRHLRTNMPASHAVWRARKVGSACCRVVGTHLTFADNIGEAQDLQRSGASASATAGSS